MITGPEDAPDFGTRVHSLAELSRASFMFGVFMMSGQNEKSVAHQAIAVMAFQQAGEKIQTRYGPNWRHLVLTPLFTIATAFDVYNPETDLNSHALNCLQLVTVGYELADSDMIASAAPHIVRKMKAENLLNPAHTVSNFDTPINFVAGCLTAGGVLGDGPNKNLGVYEDFLGGLDLGGI